VFVDAQSFGILANVDLSSRPCGVMMNMSSSMRSSHLTVGHLQMPALCNKKRVWQLVPAAAAIVSGLLHVCMEHGYACAQQQQVSSACHIAMLNLVQVAAEDGH
jgi:hypothetical protein